MNRTPFHTFNEWPVFLVLAVVLAVAAGQTIVLGYEVKDPAFMAIFGGGCTVDALGLVVLAIQTRRYKLEWAPIIAEDRRQAHGISHP